MDKGKLSQGADLLRLSTLGINFVLCTFAGLGLGLLLHKYFHWGGWVIMAGFAFGVVASYVTLFESLKAQGQDRKKPPLPMTPPGFYKGKNFKSASASQPGWVPEAVAAVGGGLLASLTAYYFRQRDIAIGLGWGSFFNALNFYSLKILTEKVLTRGEIEGRKFFWLWTPIRWVFLALGCWLFLSVSPLCLAGAGISYFWFLVVLGFASWRSSFPSGEK